MPDIKAALFAGRDSAADIHVESKLEPHVSSYDRVITYKVTPTMNSARKKLPTDTKLILSYSSYINVRRSDFISFVLPTSVTRLGSIFGDLDGFGVFGSCRSGSFPFLF